MTQDGQSDLGGFRASPAQKHLLFAALDMQGQAIEHFHLWKEMVDLTQEVDQGSFRLLPLLYTTLAAKGCTDPMMGRLKGTYRRAWCETQPRLALAHELLGLLHDAGISTMLTKGLPLGVDYYDNPTVRPMCDIDIVVPRELARDAIKLLDRTGWMRGATARDDDLEFHHAMQFFRPGGGEIDLHWSVMFECQSKLTNEAFWSRAKWLKVEGIFTRQLDHSDLLFHTVIHGVHWNKMPAIRWIADAAMILKRADRPIDWDRILELSRREKLSQRLRIGLEYLAEEFSQPIPRHVLDALQNTTPTLTERIERTIAFRDLDALYRNALASNWIIFARYCRIHHDRSWLGFLDGFSHFMRIKHRVKGRTHIPAVILKGVGKRVLHAIPGRKSALPARGNSSQQP